MSICFSWTPHALHYGVSWEVFHVHEVRQGTGMGLDAVVGPPNEDLEYLSHWDTEPCVAMGGPPWWISPIHSQGQMLPFGVTACHARRLMLCFVSCMA